MAPMDDTLLGLNVEEGPKHYGFNGPAYNLVLATLIGLILSGALVINRVYWRLKTIVTMGIDDFCIIVAWVFLLGLAISCFAAINAGYGRNSLGEQMNEATKANALMFFYVYQLFYKATLCMSKLSIVFLYLRIFHNARWFRITCVVTLLLITFYSTVSILISIFQCSPVDKAWRGPAVHPQTSQSPDPFNFADNSIIEGHCINIHAFWYANATFNIVTDFAITLSVPFVVWKLELPNNRQKIGLGIVLCLGLFTASTSIIRATSLQDHDRNSPVSDPTSMSYMSTFWSTIEASMAITCACLPMIRTPIQRLWPGLIPTYGSQHLNHTTSRERERDRDRDREPDGAREAEQDRRATDVDVDSDRMRLAPSSSFDNNCDADDDTDEMNRDSESVSIDSRRPRITQHSGIPFSPHSLPSSSPPHPYPAANNKTVTVSHATHAPQHQEEVVAHHKTNNPKVNSYTTIIPLFPLPATNTNTNTTTKQPRPTYSYLPPTFVPPPLPPPSTLSPSFSVSVSVSQSRSSTQTPRRRLRDDVTPGTQGTRTGTDTGTSAGIRSPPCGSKIGDGM